MKSSSTATDDTTASTKFLLKTDALTARGFKAIRIPSSSWRAYCPHCSQLCTSHREQVEVDQSLREGRVEHKLGKPLVKLNQTQVQMIQVVGQGELENCSMNIGLGNTTLEHVTWDSKVTWTRLDGRSLIFKMKLCKHQSCVKLKLCMYHAPRHKTCTLKLIFTRPNVAVLYANWQFGLKSGPKW